MKNVLKIVLAVGIAVLLSGCVRSDLPDGSSAQCGTMPSSTAAFTEAPAVTTVTPTEAPAISTEPLTGWQELEGKRYYFSDAGEVLTGWLDLDGQRYYLNQDGSMHTGWLELESERYYLRDDGTMAVGQISIDGVTSYFTAQGKYVVLVNRWNGVPEDYTPDLVDFEGTRVDRVCVDALEEMLSDCAEAGYSYTINSAYRSVEKQQDIWDRRCRQYIAAGYSSEEANHLVGQSVAVPGTSEHHLGLAVDLGGTDGILDWLAQNCWEYGFILRYPDGKTGVTGIIYEPWHFRYVGTELATELRELGLCMEEYMQMLTQ